MWKREGGHMTSSLEFTSQWSLGRLYDDTACGGVASSAVVVRRPALPSPSPSFSLFNAVTPGVPLNEPSFLPSFLCFARKIALASYAPGGLGPLQVGPGPNGLSFLRGLSRLTPRKNGSCSKSSYQLLFLLVKNDTFIRVEKTGFEV